jgi:hypothetical protein
MLHRSIGKKKQSYKCSSSFSLRQVVDLNNFPLGLTLSKGNAQDGKDE